MKRVLIGILAVVGLHSAAMAVGAFSTHGDEQGVIKNAIATANAPTDRYVKPRCKRLDLRWRGPSGDRMNVQQLAQLRVCKQQEILEELRK